MMKKERGERRGWIAVDVLDSPPIPPRPDEVRVRITEIDGQTFLAVVRRSDLRPDTTGGPP